MQTCVEIYAITMWHRHVYRHATDMCLRSTAKFDGTFATASAAAAREPLPAVVGSAPAQAQAAAETSRPQASMTAEPGFEMQVAFSILAEALAQSAAAPEDALKRQLAEAQRCTLRKLRQQLAESQAEVEKWKQQALKTCREQTIESMELMEQEALEEEENKRLREHLTELQAEVEKWKQQALKTCREQTIELMELMEETERERQAAACMLAEAVVQQSMPTESHTVGTAAMAGTAAAGASAAADTASSEGLDYSRLVILSSDTPDKRDFCEMLRCPYVCTNVYNHVYTQKSFQCPLRQDFNLHPTPPHSTHSTHHPPTPTVPAPPLPPPLFNKPSQ